jgi:hypothetical protein
MSDELLRAAEQLADAVEHHLEDGELGLTRRPMRSEYDEGEDGQQEFKEALELWEYDSELIKTALERALRNYRRVQERAICAAVAAVVCDRVDIWLGTRPAPEAVRKKAGRGKENSRATPSGLVLKKFQRRGLVTRGPRGGWMPASCGGCIVFSTYQRRSTAREKRWFCGRAQAAAVQAHQFAEFHGRRAVADKAPGMA